MKMRSTDWRSTLDLPTIKERPIQTIVAPYAKCKSCKIEYSKNDVVLCVVGGSSPQASKCAYLLVKRDIIAESLPFAHAGSKLG